MKIIIIFVMIIVTLGLVSSELQIFGKSNDRVIDLTNIPDEVKEFLELLDTPSSYSSAANNCVTVNAGESALEFTTCPGNVGGITKGTNGFYLYNSTTTIFFNETMLNQTISLFGNDTYIRKSGDNVTGDIIFKDSVSALFGNLGAEGKIFSGGVNFEIQALANKNINVRSSDFSTGIGGNVSIIGSSVEENQDLDGGNIIIQAGNGGTNGEISKGGLIWLKGGSGSVAPRGVHIKNAFSTTPSLISDNTNILFVEGQFEADLKSFFSSGLIVNEEGGKTFNDDFRVETNMISNAFLVDASMDYIFINAPTNITNNMTFTKSAQCSGSFEVVTGEAASHPSGSNWKYLNGLNSVMGRPFKCNGVIDGIIVRWDIDPTAAPETVILRLNDVAFNACSVTVENTAGNNGVLEKQCDISFDRLDGVNLRSNFTSGTSLIDGLAIIYGRYYP